MSRIILEQLRKDALDGKLMERSRITDLKTAVVEFLKEPSGLNDRRKGLLRLMQMARKGEITDLAISYKDRLTRFGFNYLKTYLESYGVKIHVINGEDDKKSVCEELVEDLLSIVTSFSGKLYGIRSKKKEEVTARVKEVFESAGYLPDEDKG